MVLEGLTQWMLGKIGTLDQKGKEVNRDWD